MTFFLFALLFQVQLALPPRANLENPAAANPVPKQAQKDYDKLWKRFLTGKEDAKVFADLDKFLKKNPDVLPALEIQTYIDLYAGRQGDAERRLQTVLSKRPADPVAVLYLGEFAYSRGDFVRANDLYSLLRAPGPSVPGLDMKRQRSLLLAMETLLQEARRAAAENRLADAERSYRHALRLAPREPSLHGQLADVLKRAGKTQEAEAEQRLQAQFSGPVLTLVASDNELAVAGLDDLGRWGNQIDRLK
jgi:predicted Zn-dependent protease